MKESFIIAIDGASSTGKSTLAKGLARELGFVYVDSGAMYRGITLYAQQQQWLTETHFDKEKLVSNLDDVQLSFAHNSLLLNGKDVSQEIRSMQVANAVSNVAAISEVRTFLVAQQRILGTLESIVMDGRDIGTVVFPNANIKFFLTANATIRAQRRFEELKAVEPNITLEAIFENITRRDHLDSTRADSPLIQAKDAIVLDATKFNVDEMLEYALTLIKDY